MHNFQDQDYSQTSLLSDTLNGREIFYYSKPGLPDWKRIAPSARLLAEGVKLQGEGKILVLGCGHGAQAARLAQQAADSKIMLMDTNVIALEMTKMTLAANQVANAQVHSGIHAPDELRGACEGVLIDIPKGRNLGRRWLIEAYNALKIGGSLFLAGAKSQGVRSLARDAETLFGRGGVMSYKKGNRLVHFIKNLSDLPESGWTVDPGLAPGTWHELTVKTPFGSFRMKSLPGVFSYDRLDDGTRLLIENLGNLTGERALDLGCGYGVIGLCLAAGGVAQVDLVDSNLLAIASAQENLHACTLKEATAYPSDVLSAVRQRRYTLIATNPPFHAGKPVDFQIADAFIRQSREALENGGRLLLVANRFIRYEPLLRSVFQKVEIAAVSDKYLVFQAQK